MNCAPIARCEESTSAAAINEAESDARRPARKRQQQAYSENTPFAPLDDHCAEEKRTDLLAARERAEGGGELLLDLPEEEFPTHGIGSPVSHADVLRALELVDIPDLTNGRDNVRHRTEGEEVRSLTTGVIPSRRAGKICVAEASTQRPRLTRLLVEFGKRHIPERSFRFNAITINKDLEANLHTDRSNFGPSFIIALGDFTGGGELWTHDQGSLNVKHSFKMFDGNVPHKTLPWKQGRRFALIYYTNKHHSELNCADRSYLTSTLGFPLPPASCQGPPYRKGFALCVKERLSAARDAYAQFLDSRANGARRISTPGAIIHGIQLFKGVPPSPMRIVFLPVYYIVF
jgi:hypothetical protein